MEIRTGVRLNYYHFLFFLVTLILTTVVRISLLVIAPVVILMLIEQLNLVLRQRVFILYALVFLSFLLSLFNGFFLKYNLVSFYYILPFLLFLFTKPGKDPGRPGLQSLFFSFLTFFAIVNNLIGVVQYIRIRNDDYFSGIYGHFTVTQNGLSIINSILFFYYLRRYQLYREKKSFILLLFFSVSAILGFYGAGLVILIATVVLLSIKFNIAKVIKGVFLASFIFFLTYVTMDLISPATLTYNKNIIKRFIGNGNLPVPRKLLSYSNYVKGYSSDIKSLVLGSGPGTFNSRSAFVVGSPEYFTVAGPLKSDAKPYHFENYAYTLWNSSNTVQYQDGFMNQPFSSLLAFLGEYGLLFTLVFLYFYYQQYKTVIGNQWFTKEDLLSRDLYRFCTIYLILLLIIDNYAEYPEITILIILIMKLAEKELASNRKAITTADYAE